MTYPALWFSVGMSSSPHFHWYRRKCYRMIAGFCLVLFLSLGSLPGPLPLLADDTVSRLEFCEKVAMVCLQRPLNEVAIMQSGMIDPQPDGKFHLDWPISRGDAARVCLALLSGFANARPLPGFFADIPLSSPFYAVLAKIGGAFPPLSQDKFGPDVLITPQDVTHITQVLSTHLPKTDLHLWVSPTGVIESPASWGRSFPMGFRFPGPTTVDNVESATKATERISRLAVLVPPAQLSPHQEFNLREAVSGMDELENVLDSLELSILDLVHSTAGTASQKSQLRNGLTQFRDIIEPLLVKLRFSREEVRAALLTDSESIGLADRLEQRIREGQRRLDRLIELIDERRKQLP